MHATNDEWERLIEGEFLQCPALHVTSLQAARLWGLDRNRVEEILAALVERRSVVRTVNGMYVRRAGCSRCEGSPPATPARP